MSQKQQVLRHLKEGKSISQAQAADWYNCWRLADVIFTLRGEGHSIETHMVNNRKNEGKHARYLMGRGSMKSKLAPAEPLYDRTSPHGQEQQETGLHPAEDGGLGVGGMKKLHVLQTIAIYVIAILCLLSVGIIW
jgi:hypothetical protein